MRQMQNLGVALAAGVLGWSPLAVAGEVDVRVQAGPVAPTAVTFLDVSAGPLPAVSFRAADGTRYRLETTLEELEDQIISLEIIIRSIKVRRSGNEKLKLIAEPQLTTRDGQTATIEFPLPGKNTGVVTIEMTPRMEAVLNRPPMVE